VSSPEPDPAAVPDPCRVVVIADTHLESRPSGSRTGNPVRGRGLPDAAVAHLAIADAILHAGDILDAGVLGQLAAMAPTWAVLGNNDRTLTASLPHTRRLRLAGVTIAMIHDAGARSGRAARMRRRFPDADVVVFGHSHIPCDDEGVDGQLLFNPGSPTQRRAQPCHTLGVLDLAAGAVAAHRIVALD
jgi:putative phosphoesterase